ncbi:MAG: phosphodiester glycosidase family protein [Chlorobi bacterium]|nr:phosphodiester glycosidase family protein [Chlorobiota bacterium]
MKTNILIKKLYAIPRIIVFLCGVAIFIVTGNYESEARRKRKIDTVSIDYLRPGVVYKHLLIPNGRRTHSVYVLEADLLDPFCEALVLKAKNQANELAKLHDMINEYNSNESSAVLGAVNANFWRAYSNRPIGPTLIDGELVEIRSYKQWSSGFFDELSKLYIDTFAIEGVLKLRNNIEYKIDYVNRRRDSSNLVMYNRFGGDTIPYIPSRSLKRALKEVMKDKEFDDSTEVAFDTLQFYHQLKITKRNSSSENAMIKMSLRYLNPPAVNQQVKCEVLSFGFGSLPMPENGCILSFPYMTDRDKLPLRGDTVSFEFKTDLYPDIIFKNAVSGTPRLVRNGKAKHEAYKEGSKGRRFIRRRLPRTAIGTDKSQRKIFIVAVAPGRKGRNAANLTNMATIMKKIGAYNAMNLDGGGSSVMVVDDKNVFYKSSPRRSRKISVGLGFIDTSLRDSSDADDMIPQRIQGFEKK